MAPMTDTTSPADGLPSFDVGYKGKKPTRKEQKQFTREQAMAYGVTNPNFQERRQSYLMNPKQGNKQLTPAQLAQNAIQRANEEINAGNFEAAQNYLNAAGKTSANANNAAITQALTDAQARLGTATGGGDAGAAGTGDELGPADIQDYLSRYGAAVRALGNEFNQAQLDEAAAMAELNPQIRAAQRSQYYDRQQALGNLASRGLGFAPGVGALTARAASGPGAEAAMRAATELSNRRRAVIANLLNSINRYQTDLNESDVENYNAQIAALQQGWDI